MKIVWKKLLLSAALTIISGSTVMAAAPAPTDELQQDGSAGQVQQHTRSDLHERGSRHWKHKGWGGWMMGNGIHQHMYISLLVEKYDPQSQKEWAPVLEESARLQNELKAIAKSSEKDKKAIWKDKDFHKRKMEVREKHKEVYKQFHEAVKSQDGGKIKTALGSLLLVYREQNSMIEHVLAKLKQQASASGTGHNQSA